MPEEDGRTVAKLIQDRIGQFKSDRDLHRKEEERRKAEAEKAKAEAELQQELKELKEHKVPSFSGSQCR